MKLILANNIVKGIEYMTLLQSPCVFWLNQSETLAATAIYSSSKDTTRRENMETRVIKVGNLSTGNSQAGTIYGSWGGFSNIMCRKSRICHRLYSCQKEK